MTPPPKEQSRPALKQCSVTVEEAISKASMHNDNGHSQLCDEWLSLAGEEAARLIHSHARLLAQNEMLRKALEQINGCYVGKFGGEVIGLKSNTALDEPCRIARAALEQTERK